VRIFTTDKDVIELTRGEAVLPEEAASLLDRIDGTTFGGRLDESIRRAAEACGEIDLPWREVYVFTDLQRGSITPGLFDRVDNEIPIVFFTEGDSGSTNRYLGNAELVGKGQGAGGNWTLKVGVGSSGGTTFPGVFPRLYIGGEMAGIVEVQIEGDGEKTATFPLPEYPGSRKRMSVEIEKDGLDLDDTRYILTGDIKPLRILRGRGIESMVHLELALALLEVFDEGTEEQGEEVRTGDESAPAGRVVVTTWSDREAIRQASRQGYGLVIFPDPERDLTAGGSGLRVSSGGRQVTGEGSYQGIAPAQVKRLPVLLNDLADGFGRVRVMDYYRLLPDEAWDDTGGESWRIDLDNGDPFLLGWETEGVRIVMWSITPRERSSNILLSPLFVPALDAVLKFAAGSEEDQGYFCGEPVVRNLPGTASGETVVCTYPDGGETLLERGPAGEVRFTDTKEPGFYTVSDGVRVLLEFPVNVDTRESVVNGIEVSELEELLQSQNVHVVEKGKDLEQVILSKRGGREISSWLLLTILILFLAESFISGRIHRE